MLNQQRFEPVCVSTQSDPGVLWLSTVPNNSVTEQRRPRSDCAEAQSDISICYSAYIITALFVSCYHMTVFVVFEETLFIKLLALRNETKSATENHKSRVT